MKPVKFQNPNMLLDYLRENTSTVESITIPDDSIETLLLLSEYRQDYQSPIMEAIYFFNLLSSISKSELAEMLGRFKVFHSRTKCFMSFDVDSIVSIRSEVKKRKPLYKNLQKLQQGKLNYVTLKALLSGITRLAIDHEQRVGNIADVEQDLSMVLEVVYSGLRIGLSEEDVKMLRFVFLGEE